MADESEEALQMSIDENIQLSSPPKPTRMIKIEAPSSQPNFHPKTPGSYTSSLPALAGEVAVAQKNQMLKLEERFDVLQQVKDNYQEVLRAKAIAERDSLAVARKSNMLQDDIEACQSNCDKINKEIVALVGHTETLKRDIETAESELAIKKRNNESYKLKMTSYKELVKVAEGSNEVNRNIEREKNEIKNLTKEKETLQADMDIKKLLSGEIREVIIAELLTLQETKNGLECSLKRNAKLDEENTKQSKLRREIELLQKKYQAQLTWTKKQLQETITRNKQWNEEASQKEQEIQEIKEKIKNYDTC